MGYLITHGESISLADYLTVRDGSEVAYRPTVHYAYHPCDDAVLSIHEYCGKGYVLQDNHRLIKEDIVSGMDELGVLLGGNPKGAYWYGSRLTIEQARALCPHNGATSLQTTSGVLGGIVWALKNPERGVVDPEEMDHDVIMNIARPYLGEMVGVWSEWTPLLGRERFFPESLDRQDPWQFSNILVA